MTIAEFSAEFDVLYNNITSNLAPGLNEYEKSVFLTKAQSQLVNEYFNTNTDGVGGGFDGNSRRQYDFSSLIKTVNLNSVENGIRGNVTFHYDPSFEQLKGLRIDKRSRLFVFPEDYFLAVNESIADDYYQYSVVPITYSEYTRLMMKPYSFPVKRSAWRLINSKQNFKKIQLTTGEPDVKVENLGERVVVEIIGKFQDEYNGNTNMGNITYTLRYIKRVPPIILEDLENYGTDLTLDGEHEPRTSELPVEAHREVLERAVALAKIAWQGSTATQAAQQERQQN